MPNLALHSLARIATVAICLLLSACVTSTTKAPAETLANIRTIGIASALGDELSFVSYGLTVITNDRRKIHVPEWRWDDLAADRLQTELSGRFEISTVEFNRHAVLRGPKAPYATLAQHAFAAITNSAPPPDAYLVIVRSDDRDLSGSRTVNGIGLFREDRVIRYVPQYAVYALFDILLIDSRSGGLLAATEGRIKCPNASP